ncbi:hypothetical protein FSP39_011410 [Pinctada imbricata]|uniref:Uncharacterized protein n=1 Tax=Pinctada imbricata TaxID=66713 RepID=A0AA89BKJ5_PINIB|nr:hypothetical protein FSP39_011410 [Pinctada imbricata]
MDPASSLNFGDDSELAGYGIGELTSSIDNASFFNRIPPQAASTVARDQRPRSRETDASSGGGSFLDSEATDKPTNRIQLSFSAVDQSGTLNHNGENVRKSQSADQIQQKDDESFASMVSWGGMPPYNSSTGPSRDSSLGLIAVDKMSDLSASVLMPEFEVDNKENNKPDSQYNSAALPKGSISEPLGMPNPPNQSSSLGGHKYSYTSLSQSLSKHATPLATSDRELSSLQRSKHSTSDREMSSLQGSKHSTIDWSNNLETVKKRPSMPQKLPTLPVGGIRQSLFGCKDGTLPEDSEGDVTLPEVQFGDGELDKLDDDFGNFDATYNDSAIEQDDMVLLEEDQGGDVADLDQIYLSAGTLGNSGGGRTDGNKYPSLSKVNLFDEMGSTEDLLLADRSKEDSRKRDLSKRSSTENTQSTEADVRKSGQAVGEQRNGERKTLQHRTTEVRRSDGSEIDTEDELEMARQQQSIDMVRSEGAGQSLEANKSEQLGMSISQLEMCKSHLDSERRVKKDDSNISLTMRYSAEGDIEEPPPPGDGGCGGDGESDSDSELRRQNAGASSQDSSLRAKDFIQTFKDSFKGNLNSPSATLDFQEERVRPMGDDLLREEGVHRYSTYQTSMLGDNSGLHSQYFAPMSLPPDATDNPGDSIAFQDTLYPTDDMLAQSQRDLGSSTRGAVGDPREGTITEDRLEASGFNINDFQDNNDPFDRLQSSFGSFGASPSGRGSEESHFTNVHDSPQSMARSSLNSVGSYPRPQGAGQSEERGRVQGQETEDQERNSQRSWHSGAEEEDVVSSTEGTKSSSEVMEFRKPRLSLYQSQTKRKDLEPGELTKAMPVKQSSEHSPVYQKDLGKHKQERKQDKQERKQDKDVVYRDSTGEFVTDLAFHTSFADMVATQQENLQQQFMNGTLDFDPLQNDDQFKSPSDARAMIDEDEEEFEKENVFREDENISASVVTPDSSWLQQVKTSMLCPPDMRDEIGCGIDPVRISIGTFMKSRSGAMGSLGGDSTEERPEFGMKIKTPPTNKKPCPLIEPTQDHRENVSKEGELTLFRTSGVGDEEGFSPSADKTVTLYDLHPSVDRTLKEVRADDSLPVGENEVFTPERSIGSGTPGHRTINATLNVSEVTRAMDSLPQGTKEGVEMVLGLSKNKKSVNSRSKSEVASKQSRLPVKKGSDVLSRTLESKSPNSSLNGSKDSDKYKSKASTMPVASNLDIVENARLEELRMVSDGATGLVKSNPDGEESDRSISPITGSTSNDSSPCRYKSR